MTDPAGPPENPWTITSSRSVYANRWIKVREDQVIQPDGRPGIYGVVEFQNRAVGVLAIDDDDHVWLVGQYRYPLDLYSWEIPEGGCPPDESLEDCARRELREETGLLCERLEPLVTSHLSNSVSNEWGIVYRASGLTRGPSDPEGTERLEVKRVRFHDALAMVERHEITDALTLLALLHEASRRRTHAKPRRLALLTDRVALVRLGPSDTVPEWAYEGALWSVTRTPHETSLVVSDESVPAHVSATRGFRVLALQGPIPLTEAGVLAGLVGPLARSGVAVFVVSTFDTDYLLIRDDDIHRAIESLRAVGHAIDA